VAYTLNNATPYNMDTVPFFIEFDYGGKQELAEVKPCCQADNVFYYDISFVTNTSLQLLLT
jgi:hypothetical protein